MQNLQISGEGVGRYTAEPHAPGPAAFSARSMAGVLKSRRWLIVGGMIVGLAGAASYIAATPRSFTASAEVLIDSRSDVVSKGDASTSAAPLEIPEVESQVELIRSEKIVNQALRSLPAAMVEELDREKPTVLARLTGWAHEIAVQANVLPRGAPAAVVDGTSGEMRRRIDLVRDRLMVRRVGSSYVVEVTFSGQDPALAAAVTNVVAASYVRDKIETKSQLWRGASDWLQQRLVTLGDQANTAARVAQDYKIENQIVDTGGRGLVNEQQLQGLNTALLDARAKAAEAATRLQQVGKEIAAGDAGTGDPAPSDAVRRLRQQLASLQQKRAQMEADGSADPDALRKTRSDIVAAHAAIGTELARLSQDLQSNADAAAAREASLEADFRNLMSQSSGTSKARVRSRELDRAAEAYETLYTGLLQQYNNAVNQQSFPIATAQVISDAVVPPSPSAPRRGLALILGGLAGLGLGIVAAFAREATDTSVRFPDQVEQLGVPCCAMLPVIEKEPKYIEMRRAATRFGYPERRGATPREFNADILLHMPDSYFAHAVQTVKTHIAVAGLLQRTKVIGITSSRSGEGKSTIASNLSHLYAGPRCRTLLIDADIYNQSSTKHFEATEALGLCDALSETCSLADAIRPTANPDLFVLATGQAVIAGHADILGSAAMARLLDEARQTFGCVIVDLPPVGEIVATREIMPHIDGLLLVATWRRTNMDLLKRTIRAFEFDQRKIVGVILNRAAPAALVSRGLYAGYQARMRSRAAA